MRRTLIGAAVLAVFLALTPPFSAMAQVHSGTAYLVQPGDRLEQIALRYGIEPTELGAHNGITNPALLAAGMTIWLPPGAEPVFDYEGPAVLIFHVVQRGETVHRIALEYATGTDDLLRYNRLDSSQRIKAGDVLTIMKFDRRADASGKAYLPVSFTTLTGNDGLIHRAYAQNANLSAVALYNRLQIGYGFDGRQVIIPPSTLIAPVTLQEVAEAPAETPTATASPTDVPPPTPTRAATQPPPTQAAPTEIPATPTPTILPPTPTPEIPPAASLMTVEFGSPVYYEDGRMAVVFITVWNQGVTPAIEGGQHYFTPNPDGGLQWVTLIGVLHDELPVALVDEAPLWRANVTFTDGETWPFYAGCIYMEELHHKGWEPTGPNTGFEWEVHHKGGIFDCGNAYRVKPEDIPPGGVGSVPLTVYLQHPRQWESDPPPDRRIQQITLGLWRSDGVWLGDVATVGF